MKNSLKIVLALVFTATCILLPFSRAEAATFDRDLIMDDVVFTDANSMNAGQIDAFLNSHASSCISQNRGFSAPEPIGYSPSGGFSYGGNVSAGRVIDAAAKTYGINPQVLLVTLQKEQSLVTGTAGCTVKRYVAAVGYGCPDSGGSYGYSGLNLYTINGVTTTSVPATCVNSAAKAGFSQQVIRAAWMLRFSQERSKGNVGWAVIKGSWNNSDDPQSCYSGPVTQGFRQICPSGGTTYYDGRYTIDGVSIHLNSGATAALYRYTPHFAGNQNFFNLFTNWFGGTVSNDYYSCHEASNLSGTPTGQSIINKGVPGRDALTLAMPNNTSSACVEFHTWSDNDLQNWSQHTASNLPASNPADSEIISANFGTQGDHLYLIQYRNTASGKIEIHGWDKSNLHWILHVATNHPAVDPANNGVIAADTNGDGRDEFYLVKYRGTGSGKIEAHGWSNDFQGWASHVASVHPAVDPTDNPVIAADTNGDGRDELTLLKYRSTASGKVEVHGWSPDMQGWISHIASNIPVIDPADNRVMAADTNGDHRDELTLIKYRNTGSGKVEVHGWSPDMQGWISHIATSVGAF